MKKLVLMAVAMLVLAVPAVNAQKVKTQSEVAKLEKADATLLDEKKNVKAATWVAHAKAYADAQDSELKSKLEAAIADAKSEAISAANDALTAAKKELNAAIFTCV